MLHMIICNKIAVDDGMDDDQRLFHAGRIQSAGVDLNMLARVKADVTNDEDLSEGGRSQLISILQSRISYAIDLLQVQ